MHAVVGVCFLLAFSWAKKNTDLFNTLGTTILLMPGLPLMHRVPFLNDITSWLTNQMAGTCSCTQNFHVEDGNEAMSFIMRS